MANRKVVGELTKLWDSVVTKGKRTPGGGVNTLKTWVMENPTVTSLQSTVSEKVGKFQKDMKQVTAEDVAEKAKQKVGRLMTNYEELIGIKEVKGAHSRVLSTEAKFIECQENRRIASKELSEIHNKLMEIRAELDRTQRSDDSYLDLIKQEIATTKQERIIRRHFEDLEQTEREVFSELSSALRFSHEKEREQNEKTKYWSIVGSVFGAALGIIGTTINNRMKQNHTKRIMEETSSQVQAIQTAIESLSQKVNENSVFAANKMAEEAQFQDQMKEMYDSIKMLQTLVTGDTQAPDTYENLPSDPIPGQELPPEPKRLEVIQPKYIRPKSVSVEEMTTTQQLAIGVLIIVFYFAYKLM